MTRVRRWIALLFIVLSTAAFTSAQAAKGETTALCPPVGQRAGRQFGCFSVGRQSFGKLPNTPLYWHLETYSTVAAATAAKTAPGTIVKFHGEVWLFTIAEHAWRSRGSTRVATIGPLPHELADRYAALYLQADFEPGRSTRIHRHSGVEAFYTLAGTTCLETSKGKLVQHARGEGIMVAAGLPMELTATGNTVRRGFALVLYDSSKPWSTRVNDWKPKGLCKHEQTKS